MFLYFNHVSFFYISIGHRLLYKTSTMLYSEHEDCRWPQSKHFNDDHDQPFPIHDCKDLQHLTIHQDHFLQYTVLPHRFA